MKEEIQETVKNLCKWATNDSWNMLFPELKSTARQTLELLDMLADKYNKLTRASSAMAQTAMEQVLELLKAKQECEYWKIRYQTLEESMRLILDDAQRSTDEMEEHR